MTRIDTLNDPRLGHYRGLKDRRLAADSGRFLCESKRLVLRLLASGLPVDSVLVDERRAEEVLAHVPDDVPVYVVSRELMTRTAGFEIHTGVLAVGRRPKPLTIDGLGERFESQVSGSKFREGNPQAASPTPQAPPVTLLVAPIIKEPGNLGALIRTATAFGVDGLVIGPQCCDPFYRRAVRVSMGTVFRLPIVRCENLPAGLRRLHERWGVQLLASTLDEDAEPLHEADRPGAKHDRPDRMALLLGHEIEGLDPALLALCERRITLPMHLGTDSLNVSVAAAVFCYHFMRPTKPIRLPEAGDA